MEIITNNMENYTDKFTQRVNDLVEQSKEPKTVLKRVKFNSLLVFSEMTNGWKYDVVKITNSDYVIINNEGKEERFHKSFFHKSNKERLKKAKKKEKKIKLLRNHLAILKSLIDFFKDESISSFAFSTYYNLNKIAFEEINKDTPDMNRMKFLMDSINKINKTNN